MLGFNKRLSLSKITETFTKTLSDLDALHDQNVSAISANDAQIIALESENAVLHDEASKASTIRTNIAKLLETE